MNKDTLCLSYMENWLIIREMTSLINSEMELTEYSSVQMSLQEVLSITLPVHFVCLMVATGLDILQVSMVINFDVPMDRHNNPDPESYLHRIGRSARWRNPGIAITLVHNEASSNKLRAISDHFKKKILPYTTPTDFEPLKQELERMGVE